MPRWNGGPGELAAFMKTSADQVGGDDGDVLYSRIAWYLQFQISGNIFLDSGVSWDRVNKGFLIQEKRHPDSNLIRCRHAYISMYGSKTTDSPLQLLANLHGKIDPTVWENKEDFHQMTDYLYPTGRQVASR